MSMDDAKREARAIANVGRHPVESLPPLQVAGAAIVDPGRMRILLVQRPEGKDYPFAWESPGGKILDGESAYQAIARELDEELGIRFNGPGEVMAHASCRVVEWTDIVNTIGRRIHYTMCAFDWQDVADPKALRLREGQPGIGWWTIDEMRQLAMPPANMRALSTGFLDPWLRRPNALETSWDMTIREAVESQKRAGVALAGMSAAGDRPPHWHWRRAARAWEDAAEEARSGLRHVLAQTSELVKRHLPRG